MRLVGVALDANVTKYFYTGNRNYTEMKKKCSPQIAYLTAIIGQNNVCENMVFSCLSVRLNIEVFIREIKIIRNL